MMIRMMIESGKSKYCSLTDKIYEAMRENKPYRDRQFEELISHPIGYVKAVYNDLKTDPKVNRDIASVLAVLPITTPLYAKIETSYGHSSVLVSMKSRAISAAILYAMISLGMEGREREHKKYNITNESSKIRRTVVDIGYIVKVLFPIRIATYIVAGETNPKKIILNSLMITGIGCLAGPPLLRVIDCFKDLVGVDDTGTLPARIKQRSKRFKRNLTLAYMAAGLAATTIVYAMATK
ncbi:MAG: hypothetical protein V1866_04225 [archaeon]